MAPNPATPADINSASERAQNKQMAKTCSRFSPCLSTNAFCEPMAKISENPKAIPAIKSVGIIVLLANRIKAVKIIHTPLSYKLICEFWHGFLYNLTIHLTIHHCMRCSCCMMCHRFTSLFCGEISVIPFLLIHLSRKTSASSTISRLSEFDKDRGF